MSYEQIESALQTILQSDTTTFPSTTQVTRGDWRSMDSGVSLLAVLYAGAYSENEPSDDCAINEYSVTYTVKLDLILRYTTDGATRTTFAQKRSAVLESIMQYPTLHALAGNNARRGKISSDDDPIPIFDKATGSGPFFLMQTFTIPVSDILTISLLG